MQGTAVRGFSGSSDHCADFQSKGFHRFKRRWARWCCHSRRFRVRPMRKKRAAAGLRHRQAACSNARPKGVREKLAAFMGDGICARLRLEAPMDALFSSCVFLSVVAFLVVTREACYAPAGPFAMGCSPHVAVHSPRGVGTGHADVGVSGITPRGESKPQHPARLAKVVWVFPRRKFPGVKERRRRVTRRCLIPRGL